MGVNVNRAWRGTPKPGVALTSFYEVHLFSPRSAYANFDPAELEIRFRTAGSACVRAKRSGAARKKRVKRAKPSRRNELPFRGSIYTGSFVQIRIGNYFACRRVRPEYAAQGGAIIRFSGPKEAKNELGFVFRLGSRTDSLRPQRQRG